MMNSKQHAFAEPNPSVPVYTEVKTNDWIPTHSGAGSGQYSPISENQVLPQPDRRPSMTSNLPSQAKAMILINFWSGFLSELESIPVENMKDCIKYSDSSFEDLALYQESLKENR